MYDTLSADYDRFVNWAPRLNFELPFIEDKISRLGKPKRILDAACGTGMHGIALAQRGYQLAGADLSEKMVAQARSNAGKENVHLELAVAGFGSLKDAFRQSGLFPFDVVLCLGNSLPHLLGLKELSSALEDFASCLSPGGLLLVQNRNFDSVLAQQERWMEPQSHRDGPSEWVFLRFYDFLPDGLIQFNILTLKRMNPDSGWTQGVTATRLYPLRQAELLTALTQAGFVEISCYGSMADVPFDPPSSGNLVVAARRS